MITMEHEMEKYIKKYNYLVIFPDKKSRIIQIIKRYTK